MTSDNAIIHLAVFLGIRNMSKNVELMHTSGPQTSQLVDQADFNPKNLNSQLANMTMLSYTYQCFLSKNVELFCNE